MQRHFHEELELVKEKTLKLGSLVETMVEQAVASLVDRDSRLAERGHRLRREGGHPGSRDRGGLSSPVGPAPTGGQGPALHHHRHEDHHGPGAHGGPGGEHLPAGHRAERGAPAQAVHRHPHHEPALPEDDAGGPGRLRAQGCRPGPPGHPGRQQGGCPEGPGLPGTPDLHDGGPADDPPGHSPDPRLAPPRAGRRPRHQHRGDGGLPGRGEEPSATRPKKPE